MSYGHCGNYHSRSQAFLLLFLRMFEKIKSFLATRVHFSRFLAVGLFNTALDLVLFFLIANVLRFAAVPANLVSTGITMVISFHLNHSFVFSSDKTKKGTFLQFVAITLINVWLIQSIIITSVLSLTPYIHIDKHQWTVNLLAKLCGVGISFVLNFLMYRYIFQSSKQYPEVL